MFRAKLLDFFDGHGVITFAGETRDDVLHAMCAHVLGSISIELARLGANSDVMEVEDFEIMKNADREIRSLFFNNDKPFLPEVEKEMLSIFENVLGVEIEWIEQK